MDFLIFMQLQAFTCKVSFLSAIVAVLTVGLRWLLISQRWPGHRLVDSRWDSLIVTSVRPIRLCECLMWSFILLIVGFGVILGSSPLDVLSCEGASTGSTRLVVKLPVIVRGLPSRLPHIHTSAHPTVTRSALS